MRTGVAVLAAIAPLILGACGGPAVTSSDPVATAGASSEPEAPSMSAAPPAELRLGQSFGLVYDPDLQRTVLVNGAIEGGPSRTTELWRLAVEATGDPCLGIEVSRHVRPTTRLRVPAAHRRAASVRSDRHRP